MEERKVLLDAYQKYHTELLASDGRRAAEMSGGHWQDDILTLRCLGQALRITWADGVITPEPSTLTEKILIYKYLLDATGMAGPGNEYLSFLQLPQGGHHQSSFRTEVTEPLAKRFGDNPACLDAAAQRLDGVQINGGDRAWQIAFFPKISLRVIVWAGDEEFPAQAAVLFDNKCHFHLDTDALGTAAEILTARLLEEI